jgi:antitoxin (DNA-binding transcriptional repressor) of toxin-antitoxin stability system
MKTITCTDLAWNLRRVLDQLARGGEEYLIVRNNEPVGRLISGPRRQTAMEALGDLYRTLPPKAAADWEEAGRNAFPDSVADESGNPWDSQ